MRRNRYTAYPKRLVSVTAQANETVEINWIGQNGATVTVQETVPEIAMMCEESDSHPDQSHEAIVRRLNVIEAIDDVIRRATVSTEQRYRQRKERAAPSC